MSSSRISRLDPLRRCVSCRTLSPKSVLWRVVRTHPTHQVEVDQGIGRSAYLCPVRECLQIAQKKNHLQRALRTSVPPQIYDLLRQRLL